MIPYLFHIGPISIGSYGLMMAIGFLWAWRFSRVACMRRGWDPEFAYTLVVNAMISGVIGARLFHVIDHWDHFSADPSRIFTANSGLTWYGGLILAIVTSWIWCRVKGYSFTGGLDMVAPVLAAGYAWGRVGCILAGDGCYGIPVEPPFEWMGMTFANGLVPSAVPVHPTPIYEAILNFGLFGALYWIDGHKTVPNSWPYLKLFSIFVLVHSAARFVVEFIRLNDRYWFEGFGITKISSDEYFAGTWGLSFSQWISVGGLILGVALLIYVWNRKPAPYPSLSGKGHPLALEYNREKYGIEPRKGASVGKK